MDLFSKQGLPSTSLDSLGCHMVQRTAYTSNLESLKTFKKLYVKSIHFCYHMLGVMDSINCQHDRIYNCLGGGLWACLGGEGGLLTEVGAHIFIVGGTLLWAETSDLNQDEASTRLHLCF